MRRSLIALLLLGGLAADLTGVVNADEKQGKSKSPVRKPITKKTADNLPVGARKFNGVLVGRLVKKDIEKGTFLINVDAVPRVWRNSRCENPKSLLGKNITVDGVMGKWLDVLLVVKEGETLEAEARHDGGNGLTFPGELLRKVAPFKPSDYPVLPEAFRGFNGAVTAKIVKKDKETFELIIEVESILDTWKQNRAKQPKSIVGKQMMLAGFWRRKETYHGLKVGQRIEVGLHHIGVRSDHVTVSEFVRTGKKGKGTPTTKSENGFPAGLRGFNGMLAGRLVSKDVEKGTFVVSVDAVPRVWRNSRAKNPKSIVRRNVEVDGVSGKFLDVLLLVKKGETLEFEAKHDGGSRLTFPGELLRKIAPVKPGDYPEIPEDFRGFRGTLVGKIAKKDKLTKELTLKVTRVDAGEESRARQAKAVVGKPLMIIGFWRQRDAFDTLKVGDMIRCDVRHIQLRSDHMTVSKFAKVGADK